MIKCFAFQALLIRGVIPGNNGKNGKRKETEPVAYVARWIDKSEHTRFNAFLAKDPKGHVLQSWEWGEIKSRTGWVPWRLVIEENKEIVAVASILERKIPVVGIPI